MQASLEYEAALCLLEGGQPQPAAEHFTQALTLEPKLTVRPVAAYYLEKLGKPVPPAAGAETESAGVATTEPAETPKLRRPIHPPRKDRPRRTSRPRRSQKDSNEVRIRRHRIGESPRRGRRGGSPTHGPSVPPVEASTSTRLSTRQTTSWKSSLDRAGRAEHRQCRDAGLHPQDRAAAGAGRRRHAGRPAQRRGAARGRYRAARPARPAAARAPPPRCARPCCRASSRRMARPAMARPSAMPSRRSRGAFTGAARRRRPMPGCSAPRWSRRTTVGAPAERCLAGHRRGAAAGPGRHRRRRWPRPTRRCAQIAALTLQLKSGGGGRCRRRSRTSATWRSPGWRKAWRCRRSAGRAATCC